MSDRLAYSDSPRWMRFAAAVCLGMSALALATLIPALFDPPPWNRVERAMQAWAWFYVGYIHWRLARVLDERGGKP